ncbi:MAG: ATP cone domain-containing protein, partial [Oscillospiraceae bacterium]
MTGITTIKKRDGREVAFDIEKIANAIYQAAASVGGHDYDEAMKLAEMVVKEISSTIIGRIPSVEEVQDLVERVLIEEGHAKTAKSFILYRAQRTQEREMNSTLMKIYEDLTFSSAADSDIKRENGNIERDSAMCTMLKYGSEGA